MAPRAFGLDSMPLRAVLLAGGALIVALLVAVTRSPQAQELQGAWKPLRQPADVPEVKYGRSYIFLTHHKTGTNLMFWLCNETASWLTGGEDECAWCWRVLPPGAAGFLQCAPNPVRDQGRLRGTFNRFTLLSSVAGFEFLMIQKFVPDFRAIHMIREPVTMTISAYMYANHIHNAAKSFRWDTLEDVSKEKTIEDGLRKKATAMAGFLTEMKEVHDLSRTDDRVLTLDLETFESSYDDTARRTFLHMFENVTEADTERWLSMARGGDTGRWSKSQREGHPTVAAADFISRSDIRLAWQRLEEDKDPAVMHVLTFVQRMGYTLGGEGEALRPGFAAAARGSVGVF